MSGGGLEQLRSITRSSRLAARRNLRIPPFNTCCPLPSSPLSSLRLLSHISPRSYYHSYGIISSGKRSTWRDPRVARVRSRKGWRSVTCSRRGLRLIQSVRSRSRSRSESRSRPVVGEGGEEGKLARKRAERRGEERERERERKGEAKKDQEAYRRRWRRRRRAGEAGKRKRPSDRCPSPARIKLSSSGGARQLAFRIRNMRRVASPSFPGTNVSLAYRRSRINGRPVSKRDRSAAP